MYIIGQICGLIGTVITLIQPQFRKKHQILLCCILVNFMNGLNFLLIGQTGSAVYLCAVAIFQALVSIWHHRKEIPVSAAESLLFFLIYSAFGFLGMFTAEGFIPAWNLANLIELLPIIGAWMLMLSVFARTEQQTRLFLLLNGAAWAVYTAIIGATAFFTAVAAMISSGIAMWKYRKKTGSAG